MARMLLNGLRGLAETFWELRPFSSRVPINGVRV